MVKGVTSVSIDPELIQMAKEQNINVSAFLSENLKKQLTENSSEVDEILSKLEFNLERLNSFKDRLIILRNKRDSEIKSKFENMNKMPELQNLTDSQLKDFDLLLKIVSIVREKYNIRIGISDIKNYYKENKRGDENGSTD